MANFQNNAITDNGRTLLSHVQMGAVFTPTKIVLGSGYMPAGKTARTMTAVQTAVATLTISKKERTNDGKFIVGGVYSNQQITEQWYFRELGLYAKAVYSDGTEVAEVLYSYGNAGDTAELMPAYGTGSLVERQIDIVVYIGNDAQVDLTLESAIYVTQIQLEQALQEAGGGLVVVPAGTDVPVSERKEGFLYFIEKSALSLSVTPDIQVVFEEFENETESGGDTE